jgi:uncharacterized protein
MWNLLLSLAGAYALICIGARVFHRRFVYLPNGAHCAPEKAGVGVQEIAFKAADGVTLIAWYLPAKHGKPTLLYFIGNNGRTASRADKIRKFSAGGYGFFLPFGIFQKVSHSQPHISHSQPHILCEILLGPICVDCPRYL